MIHYFNPGHETAVLNGSPYYMPPANVITMQQDLSFLPAWYASLADLVLVDNDFDKTYFNYLIESFGELCTPITKTDLANILSSEVCVWGLSPQAIHFWKDLQLKSKSNFILSDWSEKYIYLNSRMAARDCLSHLIADISQISTSLVPSFYSELEDIEEVNRNSDVQLLAKAPFSSSGRGLLWLPKGSLTRTELQILHGILKKQQYVSIEIALNKKTDFAMEFTADNKGRILFKGYSLFDTNKKGGYQGNFLCSQSTIEKYLSDQISISLLNNVKSKLEKVLSQTYTDLRNGCIGVDMMIYQEGEELKLHPCVEINFRYNMGYLSICFFQQFVCPSSSGRFKIDFSPKKGYIIDQHQQMKKQYPAIFEDKKLKSGYLSLCPISYNSHYWAYVLINADGEILHK